MRLGKWKSSVEHEPEVFVSAEFEDDDGSLETSLSVYEIADDEVCQATMEHMAGAGLKSPKQSLKHYRVDGAGQTVKDTATSQDFFVFISEAHKDILFTRAELVQLASTIIANYKAHGDCDYKVTRGDGRKYVKSRLSENDPEWLAFIATADNGDNWRKFGT